MIAEGGSSPLGAGLLAAVLAALAMGCGAGALPRSLTHPLSGRAAPAFRAASLADGDVEVPAPARLTVVDFWASFCDPCQAGLPRLDALYRERRGDGVALIAVSVDESVDDAAQTLKRLGIRPPVVVDSEQRIADLYGVQQLPITFILDRRGTVRWVGHDPAAVEVAVDVLLRERP